MTYDESTDEYCLSTGRRIFTVEGRIGLSPAMDATYGYDGCLEPLFVAGELQLEFTPAERVEIAAFMVRLWSAWGEAER